MSPSIPESTDEWGTRPVVEVSARVRKPGFIHYTITGDPDKESNPQITGTFKFAYYGAINKGRPSEWEGQRSRLFADRACPCR